LKPNESPSLEKRLGRENSGQKKNSWPPRPVRKGVERKKFLMRGERRPRGPKGEGNGNRCD